MQVYSGHKNKRALSQSTYISAFEKGLKKTFARNIKRVVRQEGRQECCNILGDAMTIEEYQFIMIDDFEKTAAAIIKNHLDKPNEHDKFCEIERIRLRSKYSQHPNYDYMMYKAGLPSIYYDNDDNDYENHE